MHVGSTYLTLSKPKDHPIHFVCTYKYKILMFVFSVLWCLGEGRCPFADKLAFLSKVKSAFAKYISSLGGDAKYINGHLKINSTV